MTSLMKEKILGHNEITSCKERDVIIHAFSRKAVTAILSTPEQWTSQL